mgnify:CR=1 FL=1
MIRQLSKIRIRLYSTIGNDSSNVSKPPTFFHNESNLPAKIETTKPTTSIIPPKPIFNNDNNDNNDNNNDSNNKDTKINYFDSYKEFCKGIAYLGIGTSILYLILEQHERVEESERKMTLMRKKQREIANQMATYKSKLNKIAIDNGKNNVILQGKLQMHIALLRKQLHDNNIDPISIDEAIRQFEENVKIDIVSNKVELWIPGESEVKKYVPDTHEYK